MFFPDLLKLTYMIHHMKHVNQYSQICYTHQKMSSNIYQTAFYEHIHHVWQCKKLLMIIILQDIVINCLKRSRAPGRNERQNFPTSKHNGAIRFERLMFAFISFEY